MNILTCKRCGDEIKSKHTHDFQTCKCGACSIDGGFEYTRILGKSSDYELRPIPYGDYPWGTRGKNGTEPTRTVRLADCDSKHLRAILATQKQIPKAYRDAIESILAERGEPTKADKRMERLLDAED